MEPHELEKLASLVVDKLHKAPCPAGITPEGVEVVNALGRARKETGATDSDIALLLRAGHDANGMISRAIRWGIAILALVALVVALSLLDTQWKFWK
jgi:hypothetical protein